MRFFRCFVRFYLSLSRASCSFFFSFAIALTACPGFCCFPVITGVVPYDSMWLRLNRFNRIISDVTY